MSFYELSHEECVALFGLNHPIPSKADGNLVYTEFKVYYESITHTLINLPETETSHMKIKWRSNKNII